MPGHHKPQRTRGTCKKEVQILSACCNVCPFLLLQWQSVYLLRARSKWGVNPDHVFETGARLPIIKIDVRKQRGSRRRGLSAAVWPVPQPWEQAGSLLSDVVGWNQTLHRKVCPPAKDVIIKWRWWLWWYTSPTIPSLVWLLPPPWLVC